MKTLTKTMRAGLMLAAMLPFASGALLAQSENPPAPTPTTAPAKETPLHEVGTPAAAAPAVASAAQALAAPTVAPVAPAPDEERHHRHNENDRVAVGDNAYVGPHESIPGNAVAVMGDVKVDGNVEGNAVAVMGSNTVNGRVDGNAVAVLGDLTLGPNAHVSGSAVSVGGTVNKDPTAVVEGNTVPVNILGASVTGEGTTSFWKHGLRLGRPVAFGPHLHLFWFFNLCLAAFYLILVLLFPTGIEKCASTLTKRPGITLVTGFLAMLGLPVLGILLLVTVVGIPVAVIVLPVGVLACIMFGKAAVYSMIGRAIVGSRARLVLAALVGIVVALLLYLVPFLGLALWFLVAFVGFATALTALFTSGSPAAAPAGTAPDQTPPPAAPLAAAALAPAVVTAAPGEPPLVAAEPPAAGAAPLPPVVAGASEAAYPKAGFWIRMAALLVDTVLIGIVIHFPPVFLPAIAGYGAVLWKLRGSTIGGIIFRLKVVRVDGRPMDWVTAIVRALACFLSLVFIGLGFVWIGFDPEKQGWHDKIAGTVVVKSPRGIALV